MTEPLDQTPAAPGSLLAGLRARREKVMETLFVDLVVPRLDPPVYVRYGPADQAKIDAANQRAAASKDKDATANANAAVLADACLGVFERGHDGEPIGDPDDWPRFDDDLADMLGAPKGKAAPIVRALYLTDGDVISTAGKLTRWSGYADDQLGVDEGKLSSDPAVQAAAVAITFGLDPLWYLGLSPHDLDVATAAMNIARQQRQDDAIEMAVFHADRVGRYLR